MSKSARTDEIDALVSSVRDFVSHKDPRKSQPRKSADRLVLTPDQLVAEPAKDAEDPINADVSSAEDAGNVHLFDTAKRDAPASLEAALSALGGSTAAAPKAVAAKAQAVSETAELEIALDDLDAIDSSQPEAAIVDPASAEEPATPIGGNPPVADPSQDDETATPMENLLAVAGADVMAQEALRAMITEIVHEELTGELGERMTRNVRKLVRREINRVLVSKELGQD